MVEEQNGFRKNRNCLEHIFTLSSIVGSRLQEKKHTFCCFVDFSKAFDFVNRDLLIFALKQIGINGKFLNMFKAMYDETEAAVKISDKITHWFLTKTGVRQGQNDSPTAFSILINSLAKDLIQLQKGIQYGTAYVTVLLYADDIVILSDCEENMQIQLNKLSAWCKKWRMNINIDKTKIIQFRTKRSRQSNFMFYLGRDKLKLTDKYRYLGCTLNEYLDFRVTARTQAEGSSRSLGKLLSKFYLNKGLGYETYKKLYNSCIVPIMDYSSAIWGYNDNDDINKVHQRSMRNFLGVYKYAPTAGVEGDLFWVRPLI